MFECSVDLPGGRRDFLGLNEVVVQTGPPFHMIEIDLSIDGDVVSTFRGDGLIVSTPIGSTAHSLSAGGPILGQELHAFVVSPICPHSLTSRPVVESADKEYIIHIRQATSAWMVVDGQEVVELQTGSKVILRKAPVPFRLVKVPGRTYYRTLRDKLNWGTTPNYRSIGGSSAGSKE